MKILSLFVILTKLLCADPFYYGDDREDFLELRLYGIMNARANINGEWIKRNQLIPYTDKNFKIIEIQTSCVLLSDEQGEELKLCLKPAKILGKSQ